MKNKSHHLKPHHFPKIEAFALEKDCSPVCVRLPEYLEEKLTAEILGERRSDFMRAAIVIELIRRKKLKNIEICQAFNDRILSINDISNVIRHGLLAASEIHNWLLLGLIDEDLYQSLDSLAAQYRSSSPIKITQSNGPKPKKKSASKRI